MRAHVYGRRHFGARTICAHVFERALDGCFTSSETSQGSKTPLDKPATPAPESQAVVARGAAVLATTRRLARFRVRGRTCPFRENTCQSASQIVTKIGKVVQRVPQERVLEDIVDVVHMSTAKNKLPERVWISSCLWSWWKSQ